VRLKTLLIIGSLLLTACPGVPPKPEVEIGVLDVPAQEIIVGHASAKNFDRSALVNYGYIHHQMTVRKPIMEYDKAVCARPPEWVKIRDYIDALERFIEMQCKKN